MKTLITGLLLFLSITALLGGCGYYFPHIYEGPQVTVYLPEWKNRTNQLDIDTKMYRSLSGWFQKSKAISTTKIKENADLALAGEIISLDLPSAAWDENSVANVVKVRLKVRYVLKDLKSDEILWEEPGKQWSEDSAAGNNMISLEDENRAVEKIIDDISQRLYIGTLDRIRKKNQKPDQTNQKLPAPK
ncbi:MAG: LPS assembly lipoprotein LptE [Desulfobulbaceae bacterium]|nr:LPS assembly lipoprotein LptE [Desulfobulbaceae bacterium]